MGDIQNTPTFGLWVTKQRKNMRMSRARFAKLMGCSTLECQRIERGEGMITSRELVDIAAVFCLQVNVVESFALAAAAGVS